MKLDEVFKDTKYGNKYFRLEDGGSLGIWYFRERYSIYRNSSRTAAIKAWRDVDKLTAQCILYEYLPQIVGELP